MTRPLLTLTTALVLGAFYVAAYGNTSKRLRLMMGSLIFFAATLFAFALSPWFLLALPLVLVSDVFANIFGTSNNTIIQLLVPDEVRGRVTSLLMMSFGFTPLGTVPVAAAAQLFGAPAAVAAAAVMTILLTIAFWALSGSLRNVDETTRLAIEAERERPPTTRFGRHDAPARAGAQLGLLEEGAVAD